MRWLIALLLLAFAVHAPSLGNDFALDDRYVAKAFYNPGEPNEMIDTLQPLGEYFGSHYWRGVERSNPLYRPVTILSYALVYQLLGKHCGESEALPQHLLNLLLFVVAVWLVWLLLEGAGARGIALGLATAVFATHAIHAEAVSAVSGRAELLAFCCGAAFVLLGRRPAAGIRRGLQLLAAAGAFFLAIASKENALAFLPFAVVFWLAADWAHGKTVPLARGLVRHALLAPGIALLPIAAFFMLRHGALAKLEPGHAVPWVMNPIFAEPASIRLPSATMVWGYGLLKTLLPFSLAADYGASVFTLARSWLDLRVLVAIAALGALLAMGLRRARRDPLLFLAACAFLGFSFATTNLPLPIGTLFAERLYFSPSLGLSFAVAALLQRAAPRWQPLARLIVVLWCVVSAGVAFARAFDWKDDATLYTHDAATQPRSMFLRLNAAVIARQRGDAASATRHLREAVAIEPLFARGWNDLGGIELASHDLQAAETSFRNGLASPRADPRLDVPMLRLNLALVLMATRREEQALDEFEAVLRMDPGQITPRLEQVFGLLHGSVRDERLLAFLERGEQLAPAATWRLCLGMQLVRMAHFAEGEPLLRRALPETTGSSLHPAGSLYRAKALAELGDSKGAAAICGELAQDARVPASIVAQARQLLAALPR